MKLEELKEAIENKTVTKSPIVFLSPEDTFIAKQYLYEMKNIFNLPIIYVLSFSNSLFSNEADSIEIMIIDKLDKKIQMKDFQYIITKEVDSAVKSNYNIVEIPKILSWQVEDYLLSSLSGIDSNKLKWLYSLSNGNIYKLQSEIDRLQLFNKEQQNEIFNEFANDFVFSDLSQYNIFSLSNALLKHDIGEVFKIYCDIDKIDINIFGLIKILIKNFIQILRIQTTNVSAEQLGLSQKQFNAIKYYNCGKYSKNQLIDIITFLSEIDFKIKSGYLPQEISLDYVITKVLMS